MSELQETIIEEVRHIENEELLQAILAMILNHPKGQQSTCSAEMLLEIEQAREQYRNGQVKPHRQVMDETRKWLLSK